MAISKVVYKTSSSSQGVVWIDATSATASASDIISPKTAMLANGVVTQGTGSGAGTYQAKTNIDPTTSSQTITPDNGYAALSSVQINAMPSGTAGTPTASKGTVSNHSVIITPSVTNITGYITGSTKTGTTITVSASELVSGTYNVTSSGTKDVTNYESVSVSALTLPSSTSSSYSGTEKATVSRSTSVQYINIPTGYNDSAQYYTILATSTGTEGTPVATKGTVSNHSITVTPGVTNSEGYISGGTHVGTPVTVSASELVSGTYTVNSSGTVDITNYASLSVPSMTLPSSTSGSHTGTSKATVSRSTSAQYINIPTGFNSTAQYYTISAVPDGTEGTPTATKGTVNNHSVSITPSVTNSAGYIYGGTKTGTAVTVSASELVSGSETKQSNGTYDVTNLASLVVAVPIVTYYTGSSTPSSSLGSNGDIYLQTGA